MSAVPIDFQCLGLNPGEVPKVRVTYQCDDADDAMRETHRAVSTHGNVDAHYDRETRILVLEVS